jgi:2-polyprenyl-3-methyl-5-hydroxy-6-metoxy-1,4-benzoquinol methylase
MRGRNLRRIVFTAHSIDNSDDHPNRVTTALSFTGERFHPDLAGEMWSEHWHRYHFVLPLIAGKAVLDVASGEGYGSALMATRALSVAGIDISPDAVAHAGAMYAKQRNLTFAEGSCAKLPFANASFDAVVSFETIEHIAEQDDFLDEIKRVLKPAGLLVLSSPNRAEYSDARGFSNEFHVKELYRPELADLLGKRFRHLQWYSQRNAFVSTITPEGLDTSGLTTPVAAETFTVSKASPATSAAALPALYFLVVASNDGDAAATVAPRLSVFTDCEEWAYNDYRQVYRAMRTAAQREQALEARCAILEHEVSALRTAAKPTSSSVTGEESLVKRLLKRFSG